MEENKQPRSGYVSVKEGKDGTLTMRLPQELLKDFDKCSKYHQTTRSKMLRVVMERFIEETEEKISKNLNPVDYILTLPEKEQYSQLDTLTDPMKLEYLNKKMILEKNQDKDREIESSFS